MDYYCTNYHDECPMAGEPVDLDWDSDEPPTCDKCGEPMVDYVQYRAWKTSMRDMFDS